MGIGSGCRTVDYTQHLFIAIFGIVKRITIPNATVARLPLYLKCLEAMSENRKTVSSANLADAANVNPSKVRKDLSYLGSNGTRGVGYDRIQLCFEIRGHLGLNQEAPVVIVGAGNLGSALANYGGFPNSGFYIVGVYDLDPNRIGTTINDQEIQHIHHLEPDVAHHDVTMGVITTPPGAAQETADRMVAAGIRSILNFAPTVIHVPDTVDVRRVDLSTELQILSYYERRRRGEQAS